MEYVVDFCTPFKKRQNRRSPSLILYSNWQQKGISFKWLAKKKTAKGPQRSQRFKMQEVCKKMKLQEVCT